MAWLAKDDDGAVYLYITEPSRIKGIDHSWYPTTQGCWLITSEESDAEELTQNIDPKIPIQI